MVDSGASDPRWLDTRNGIVKRLLGVIVGGVAAATLVLPAVADQPPVPVDGPVGTGSSDPSIQMRACAATLTYFYNSDLKGASKSFCGPVANLAGYTYDTGSDLAGYGQAVKNNAASIRHLVHASGQPNVNVYELSNYGGKSNYCVPGCQGNLTPDLKNENASHKWG